MAGGGILFDHGWHAIYCVMRWAGAPLGVAAQLETRRFHEHPLEDTASVDLDTALGASNIYLTWAADERSNTIEIEGEKGEISRRWRRRDSELEFAGAALVLPALPIGGVTPSRLVRRCRGGFRRRGDGSR